MSYNNVSFPGVKNMLTNSWPMFRTNSPWDTLNSDAEYLYAEEISRYAEILKEDKMRKQQLLDENIPKSGGYSICRPRYLKLCHKPKDNNGLYAVRFNEDASYVIAAYENGLIEAYDVEHEMAVFLNPASKASFGPSSIKFHPINKEIVYISCASGNILMGHCQENLSLETWNSTKIITEGKHQIQAMDVTITGEKMITGGKDSRIRIYDLETFNIIDCYKGFAMECWKDSYRRLLDEDEEEGHYLNIYSIVCHPTDPFIFASAGLDCNIKIWDLRVKQYPVKNIYGPHIMGDAIDLQDNKVLSGQWASDDGIQLWDTGSCRLLKTFQPPNMCPQSFGQYFYCTKFMKGLDGSASGDVFLAGGAGMGGLIVGSLEEDQILACFKDGGSILCVDNNSEFIVYGGTSHVFYLSQFSTNAETDHGSERFSGLSSGLQSVLHGDSLASSMTVKDSMSSRSTNKTSKFDESIEKEID